MTNQERMSKLNPEDFYKKIDWLFHKYANRFTVTEIAIVDWLKSETGFNDSDFMIVKRDDEFAKEAESAVRANDGYCPCKIFKTDDTKCMCLEFRSQDEPGVCECGLYEKIRR